MPCQKDRGETYCKMHQTYTDHISGMSTFYTVENMVSPCSISVCPSLNNDNMVEVFRDAL